MKYIYCTLLLFLILPFAFCLKKGKKPVAKARVIGGLQATRGQFPYHVSVFVEKEFRCGGSAISKKFVLTAAHCFFDKNLKFNSHFTEIIIGHTSIFEPKPEIIAQVEQFYIPKEFLKSNNWYFDGDIAVLKLNRLLNIPQHWILGLPNKNSYAGRRGIVTGNGVTREVLKNPYDPAPQENVLDGLLRYDEVKVLTNDECSKIWNNRHVSPKLICAKTGLRRPAALCDGDSGGPLVIDRMVIGVLSVGSENCDSKIPEIFTRVSEYVSFINQAVHDVRSPSILTYYS